MEGIVPCGVCGIGRCFAGEMLIRYGSLGLFRAATRIYRLIGAMRHSKRLAFSLGRSQTRAYGL